MIEGVIVGLVTAGALGLARLARSIISRARSRKTPLRVIADIAESESWTLVLPGALPGTDHPQDSATSDVYRWLRSRGAVSYLETRVRLRIEGVSPETVTVTNMAVEMDRRSPLSGVRVHCPTAGALASTLLIFYLDEEHPIAWEWVEDMGRELVGETPHFNRHSYAITHGEVLDLQIVGRARNAYLPLAAQLDLPSWGTGGRGGSRRPWPPVRDHGGATAGIHGGPRLGLV
ncbi:MAG: hypothetical protein KY429_11695 [Actinobacteria bacterium]|nr:hypothetical protein [Actinomycetota bacterium]